MSNFNESTRETTVAVDRAREVSLDEEMVILMINQQSFSSNFPRKNSIIQLKLDRSAHSFAEMIEHDFEF